FAPLCALWIISATRSAQCRRSRARASPGWRRRCLRRSRISGRKTRRIGSLGEPRGLHCRSEAGHASQSHQAAATMIKVDHFNYSDADWDKIKRAAEKGLDYKAGAQHRHKVWIGGRWHPALLWRLEMMATFHIAVTAQASAERQRSRIRQLEALKRSAPR